MYDRLLIPTDGSETAQLVTDHAIDLATRYEATVHALYVVEKTRKEPVETGLEETIIERRKHGRTVLSAVEKSANRAGCEIHTTIKDGVPRTVIESYTADHEIELIVIGSTGASDVTEKLLGTVAKYVVNEAPADVLVVRPDAVLT